MQEELAAAKRAAVNGDRLSAIWHAHQSLEDDLASVKAALVLVKKGQQSVGSFDPAVELSTSVSKVCEDAVVCMRLFTVRRELGSTKGMVTVEALYKRGAAAPTRLTTFASVLRAALDGWLPPAIALSIGLSLRKLDAQAAKQYVSDYIEEYIRHLRHTGGEGSVEEVMRAAMMGTATGGQQLLPALLRLDVECSVPATGTAVPSAVQHHREALGHLLSADAAAELDAYETRYRAEHPRQWARLQERRQKDEETLAALAKLQKNRGSKSQGELSAATPVSNSLTAGKATAPRTLQQMLTNPLNVSGWKLHASRAAVLLAVILLLRLLTRQGAALLTHLRSMTRSSPSQVRRRKLTL